MYKCGICKKTTAPGIQRRLKIIERNVPSRSCVRILPDGRREVYTSPVRKEIAKEIPICPECDVVTLTV